MTTPEHKADAPMTDDVIYQPLCSIFRRFLKGKGLKFTTERAMILDAVLAEEELFEVEELMYRMREAGHRVSKATIYRTVKHLVEAGIIQEVLLDAKTVRYQLIHGREHKDHLVCVENDEVIEFSSPELTELRDRICREHGMEPVGHRFLIYAVRPGQQSDGERSGGGPGQRASS